MRFRDLEWDELEFLECLGVLPDIGEADSYSYSVRNQGLTLLLTVWTHESVLQLTLTREGDERALVSFSLFVRGSVRSRKDPRGEYLEVRDAVILPAAVDWSQEEPVPDDADGHVVEITALPDIQVTIAG